MRCTVHSTALLTYEEPIATRYQTEDYNPPKQASLRLHEVLFAYARPVLLPQSSLLRLPSWAIVRYLPRTSELPQPVGIRVIWLGDDLGLALQVVQAWQYGAGRT